MKKIKKTITLKEYQGLSELKMEDRWLLELAKQSSKNAYAPYSKFNVGAAVSLENGEIVLGNNQENAAYPSGLCAERVAIYYAASQFNNMPIKTIAIYAAFSKGGDVAIISPCGACRQAIIEYRMNQESAIRVLLKGKSKKIWLFDDIHSLLPYAFDLKESNNRK